jgi:hypothetical protein
MSKSYSHRAVNAVLLILLGGLASGCVTNPTTPQTKSDWYLGSFEGGAPGQNARRLSVSCPTQTQCRLSMPSVSLAPIAALPIDTSTPKRALKHTRRAYEDNPSFFEGQFKQDVFLLRPLLAKSSSFESCFDVGSIRNMFFLCSTTDDPTAQKGAVILGTTLVPYSESTCRTKLYCDYYLVPVSRK